MIYDGFMFYNENDCLDIRLQELSSVVDKFVIVQSNVTFRGHRKPDYFDYDRFKKYESQLIFIYMDMQDMKFGAEPDAAWERETYQRNGIGQALTDAEPDDIILVSDADEIPRRSVVESLDPVGIDALMMQVFIGGINVLAPNEHTIRACRMRDFTTAQQVRKHQLGHIIYRGGWEFSSLGTPEQISQKLKAFSHWELDKPEITDPKAIYERQAAGMDPYGFGLHYDIVQIDDTWPEAIKNDRDKWRKFEW